jgi:diaminopimelate decarboxylase
LRFIEPYVRELGADTVDLGGGYGVLSSDFEETERAFQMFGAFAKEHRLTLIFEFGKVAAIRAGVLVTRVTSVKERGEGQVAFVDASSFNLGTWERRPLWLTDAAGEAELPTRIQGATCYEHDVFAQGSELPPLKAGDKLVFSLFGAYATSIGASLHGLPAPREAFFGD